MNATEITDKIIAKGGLIGQCVESWRQNNGDTDVLFRECSEIARTPFGSSVWGDELIAEILGYFDSKRTKKKNERADLFKSKVISTIITIRKSKNILKKKVASALNMSKGNYTKMEKGERPLGIGELSIIAEELNVPIDEIIVQAKSIQD